MKRPQKLVFPNVILKQILTNALRLVLVVDRCAPTQSDRTTVAVAPDTDWTLTDTIAMVYIQYNNIVHIMFMGDS
jgi:hypothetical protein